MDMKTIELILNIFGYFFFCRVVDELQTSEDKDTSLETRQRLAVKVCHNFCTKMPVLFLFLEGSPPSVAHLFVML